MQSVPRFFSPTRSSLCFFSVVNPPFLPMPLRLGYSWNRILSKHTWQVKDYTCLSPLFQQPCTQEWTFCFFQYLRGTKNSWMDSWWYQHKTATSVSGEKWWSSWKNCWCLITGLRYIHNAQTSYCLLPRCQRGMNIFSVQCLGHFHCWPILWC